MLLKNLLVFRDQSLDVIFLWNDNFQCLHGKIMKIDQKTHCFKVPELFSIFQFFDQCFKDSLEKNVLLQFFSFLLEDPLKVFYQAKKYEV